MILNHGNKQDGDERFPATSRRSLAYSALAVLLALCLVLSLGGCYLRSAERDDSSSAPEMEEISAELQLFYEVYNIIKTRYAGEMDTEEMVEEAIKQFVNALDDPYSQYMTNEQADTFIDGNYGNKVGIGVRIYKDSTMTGSYIYQVFEGSPAHNYGVKKGDVIVGVDGVMITDDNYNELIDSVAGEVGTTVTLTVKRSDETLELPIVRGNFTASSVEYRLLSDSKTAYVRILNLATDTAKDFKKAILDLKERGAEKYIFDVREDSGGYLSTIIEVLDMLLPEGPIVRYNDATGKETADYSDASTILEAPMAVIIDGGTASAAELFAAALKDYELAVLVGETTYGKGVMQSLFTLSNGDTLKLTTSTYSPPYSENYDGIGVMPDVEVSLTEDKPFFILSEEEDTQLQAAIKALEDLEKQD